MPDTDPPDDPFGPHPTAEERATGYLSRLIGATPNSALRWTTTREWLDRTEPERLDILDRLVRQAKHDHATGRKDRDAVDSARILDIASDLWHATDWHGEPRS